MSEFQFWHFLLILQTRRRYWLLPMTLTMALFALLIWLLDQPSTIGQLRMSP